METIARVPYFRSDKTKAKHSLERWNPGLDYYLMSELRLFPPHSDASERVSKVEKTQVSPRLARGKEYLNVIAEENRALLKRFNPGVDEKDFVTFSMYVSSVLSIHKGEHGLFSFYMLNEFLRQEQPMRYEHFIDVNWSRLYSLMDAGEFHIYQNSLSLLKLFLEKNSVLLIRSRSSSEIRLALEGLTQSELKQLVKLPAKRLSAQVGLIVTHVPTLLNPPTEEKLPPKEQVIETLFLAYSKSFVQAKGNSPLPGLRLTEEYLTLLHRLERIMYENPVKIEPGQISSAVVHALAKALLNESEEIQPLEHYFFVFALVNPSTVASGVSTKAARALFEYVSVLSDEEVRILTKRFAELVQTKRKLPPLKVWKRFLENGDASLAVSHELMVEFMGGSEVLLAPQESATAQEMRRLFNKRPW